MGDAQHDLRVVDLPLKSRAQFEKGIMGTTVNSATDLIEGLTFIIGREGHIYISDRSVSRHHAELKLINGEIHLRDLDSSNGTFVVVNNKPVQIKEAIVKPRHTVVIGKKSYTVAQLLAVIHVFGSPSEKSGLAKHLH